MAQIVQAVRQYGPRVAGAKTVQLEELAEWMAARTGIHESQVAMVLAEINEAISYFTRRGAAVRLPGVGRFGPSMRRDGRLRVSYTADHELRAALNASRAFRGDVLNRGRIGLDDEGYKVLWDADHPTDPLDV